MLFVPAGDELGGAVSVTVDGVGVEVAFVPAPRFRGLSRGDGGGQPEAGKGQQAGASQHPGVRSSDHLVFPCSTIWLSSR